LPKLSDLNMRNVIAAAEMTRNSYLRSAIARAALQRIADDPALSAVPRNEEGGAGTAGLAARLLADNVNAADRDLIDRVVRMRPHDPGLWLALAKSGISNADDLSLARSVMQDGKAPRWARLAAAAALAPADSDARAYVTAALTSFLSTFGQTTAESVLAEAYRQPQINQDPRKAAEFQPGLLMIGILEFLQTPDAERLTFEYLDATNLWVRTGLGLVAAMRWPNRFLDSVPSHFDESIKLRAAVTVLHPELLSRVQALVPPDDLEKWRSKMLKDGVETVFSLPGNAGLVF
jgi:hypothetical protein